jgi:hypothetical protein
MTANTLSANGRAFQAYLESARAVLDGVTAIDYHQSPLPAPLDELLAAIAGAFTALAAPERERFMAALSDGQRALFGLFGHRAATLATRRADPDQLRLGLVGSVIANYIIPDKRNVEVALAVFHHCARKLELNPTELFDEAAHFATDEMAARLRAFGRRADVTLRQFGWREIRDEEGVRYKFEWR